jgi:hypothetical protein
MAKKKSAKSSVKARATAKAELVAKATYSRKRVTTEVIPPDVTRARSGAWLNLVSPLTEWAALKGDQIRHRRDQLRIQREDVLSKIIRDAANRIDYSAEKRPIPNKFIVPFLEKASLEDENSEVMKLWSQLLVSAATEFDPTHLRVIDILSQIGPNEANYLKKLVHGSRSGRGLHFIADVPHFFSSQFLGILAKHGFDDHNGGPNELLSRLISEVEHPGGLLNFVYILGFDEEEYECEFYHPDYVSEEEPTPSTLENLGLILMNKNLHFERGTSSKRLKSEGVRSEKAMMIRTVSITSFGLLFLKTCDEEVKAALDAAELREAAI